MKHVVVMGATGTLAGFVIEALKASGQVNLTLFARTKRRLNPGLAQGCRVIEGNALNYEDVTEAVKGQDIVYVNLAGDLEPMVKNIIRAMKEAGVKRIIAISSIGIYDHPLKSVLIPYRRLADAIENSGLVYTILRPDWFTNGNEVDYAITRKGEPESGTAISRKSIAAFIASVVEDPGSYVNSNVGISKPA